MTTTYEWLAVAELRRDDSYQRETNHNRVKQLAREWNPRRVELVKVSRRSDGSLYVYDGFHRALAQRERDPKGTLLCQVDEGMTVADEAREFAEQDDLRRRVNVGPKLWALYVAGDLRASEFVAALKAHGYRVTGAKGLDGETLQVAYFARAWSGPTETYWRAMAIMREAFGDHTPKWALEGYVFGGLLQALHPELYGATGHIQDAGMAVALRYAERDTWTLRGTPTARVAPFRNILWHRYNTNSRKRGRIAYEA